MTPLLLSIGAALWLGVLTSIHPCPMANNVAAISFLARRFGSPRRVLLAGLAFTAGRVVVYAALGAALAGGLMSAPHVSTFLQKYANAALGPLMIFVAAAMLGWIPLNFSASAVGERVQQQAEKGGLWGAALLGAAFALSFCPLPAAYFFGNVIPLAASQNSAVLVPVAFGVGTGLPVLAFAFLAALGASAVSKTFNRLQKFETWGRRLTAGVFLLVGAYYCLVYLFGVQLW